MTTVAEWLLAGALVAVVLVGTYAVVGYGSRRRVEQDFEKPDDILTAVDVYVKYGRNRAAIDLLKRGVEKNPEHLALRSKLADLTDG